MRQTGHRHRLELTPFVPELVGQKALTLVMGKNSGIDSVRSWLQDADVAATEAQMLKILAAVKQEAFEKKSLLSRSEFLIIAERVIEKGSGDAPGV